MLVSSNLVLHLAIIIKGCTGVLAVVSIATLLIIFSYIRVPLLDLHFCELFNCPSYTTISLFLSSIKLAYINMIRTNTRVVTTAWYPCRILLHNLSPSALYLIKRVWNHRHEKPAIFKRFDEKCDPNSRSLDVSLAEYVGEGFCEYL